MEPQSSPTSSSQNEVTSEIIENSPGVENSILMVETPQPIAKTTRQNTSSPPSHPSYFPNICQDYLKASCTKGQSCELNHPEVCPNLLDHGLKPPYGCNGKECHDLHPPLCKNSLRHNRCFNVNCKYYHLKGKRETKTKRKFQVQITKLSMIVHTIFQLRFKIQILPKTVGQS